MRAGFVALAALVLAAAATASRGDHHLPVPFFGRASGLSSEELLQRRVGARGAIEQGPQVATLTANPTTVADGGDSVISWTGVPQPSANDFVTCSCGPTSGLNDYLDMQNVTAGTSSLRFGLLIMMRCNYVFTYVSTASGKNLAIGSVTVTMQESFAAPKQGHLALGDTPDQMWVLWTSGSEAQTPTVQFGLSPSSLLSNATGASHTYTAASMCQAPATVVSQVTFRDPGYMHEVLLHGLAPNTVYFYRFGNSVEGWSDVFSFLSPPTPSQPRDSIRFLAFADMGVDPPPAAQSTMALALEEVENGYRDFLLHFGDISYARSAGYVWEFFFRELEPLATRVPYMISIGNHEYDHTDGGAHDPSGAPGQGFHPSWGNYGDDSNGECAVPMASRFRTPSNGKGIFWYSFNYGLVHVLQMSTEHDWLPGSEQYEWMVADLAAVDRSATPWVIITGHRMMYTTQLVSSLCACVCVCARALFPLTSLSLARARAHSPQPTQKENSDKIVSLHMQQALDDVLYKYQVNAMLVGHQHSYERSCPVYNLTCRANNEGTVHIIVGTAGAGLETGGFSPSLGNWSLVQTENWGYSRFEATREYLHMQFVLNVNGEVFDDLYIPPWGTPSDEEARA
jgi:hypothetical protein